MNIISVTGRVVRDAEPSVLPGSGIGKASFTICVERNYQKDKNNKKVDFIPVEVIGNHATKLAQYLTKGKMIGVTGEINIDTWEKDGQKKSFTKIKADKIEFLGGGKQENNTLPNEFEAINDEELPF